MSICSATEYVNSWIWGNSAVYELFSFLTIFKCIQVLGLNQIRSSVCLSVLSFIQTSTLNDGLVWKKSISLKYKIYIFTANFEFSFKTYFNLRTFSKQFNLRTFSKEFNLRTFSKQFNLRTLHFYCFRYDYGDNAMEWRKKVKFWI